MANLDGFDATQVEPNTGFEPLPENKYTVMIADSRTKPTKKGEGSFLELELVVLDGPFKDRKIWDRLCLNHPKPQVVEIARKNLSAICRAVGVLQPHDSCELHNIPLTINLKLKKRNDNGDLVNEVKGYASCKRPSAQTPPTPQNGSTPPWRRTA